MTNWTPRKQLEIMSISHMIRNPMAKNNIETVYRVIDELASSLGGDINKYYLNANDHAIECMAKRIIKETNKRRQYL